MSRVGRLSITLPSGVTVAVADRQIAVKGPKGELTMPSVNPIAVEVKDNAVSVSRPDDERRNRALHGLVRTLIAGMVDGVTKGYSRTLEIQGVGYRAQLQGKNLSLQLGFSHPVVVQPPKGIDVKVEGANKIVVSGADKQQVGQFAAEVRSIRPPEPYKGKGIRYEGERVRRKLGKAGKTVGGLKK